MFALAKNPNQIAYASLPIKATLSGSFTLSDGYDTTKYADFPADFSFSFAEADNTAATSVVNPVVPEPSSAILAGLGSLALLAYRRRRNG